MYKVIKYFTDLEDNRHEYHVGDTFPHDGRKITEERLAELSSDKNKRHVPLIEKVAEDAPADEVKAEETKATRKPRKRAKKG